MVCDRELYATVNWFSGCLVRPKPIQLCEFNRHINIPPGASAEEVWQLLPSLPDQEIVGYATERQIRACLGCRYSLGNDIPGLCTFRCHATRQPLADQPTEGEIVVFLRQPALRHISVGRNWAWIWDRTPAVLKAAQRLLNWEISEWGTKSRVTPTGRLRPSYFTAVCAAIDVRWLQDRDYAPREWARKIEDSLGIHTRLIRRKRG
jgi:hypothetical protein